MHATLESSQRVVPRDEWVTARKALLAEEKELTRRREELAARRRALPWVMVEKEYTFDTPAGRRSLPDLFDGRSQLVVYHFMLGPGWAEGCPSCSLIADGIDAAAVHVAARDVTLLAVSRAPLAEIAAFKRRMGWRFAWVSSNGSDFNYDFHVSFTPEELSRGDAYYNYANSGFGVEEAPGTSVFYKDARGNVFHTYSSYARGLDPLIAAYHYLDLVPKGRDEDGLAFSMSWVRHHDRYGAGYAPDPAATYAPPAKVAGAAEEACPACAAAAEAEARS